MSPGGTKTSSVAARNYTLCTICNLKGKKGNRLLPCAVCNLQVHWHCSSILHAVHSNQSSNAGVNAVEEEDAIETRRICNKCKSASTTRRSSGQLAMTSTTSRRSNQSAGARRSAPLSTTPTSTVSKPHGHTINGRQRANKNASGAEAMMEIKCNGNLLKDMEKEITALRETVHDLQILCTNTSQSHNALKLDHQRHLWRATAKNRCSSIISASGLSEFIIISGQ